jgi:hypothetical protein
VIFRFLCSLLFLITSCFCNISKTDTTIWASNEAMAAVIEHGTESFVEYAASQGKNQAEAIRFAQTAVWAVESVATGAAIVGIAKLVQNKVTIADKIKTLKANVSSIATRAFQRTQSSKVRVDTTSLESIARAIEQSPRVQLLAAIKVNDHHIFPQQFKKFFAERGIKINDYTVSLGQTTHLHSVHGKGSAGLAGRWNSRWEEFIQKFPNATTREVYQFAGSLMDEFKLNKEILHGYKK